MGVLDIYTHFSFLIIQGLELPIISTVVYNKSIEDSPLTIFNMFTFDIVLKSQIFVLIKILFHRKNINTN